MEVITPYQENVYSLQLRLIDLHRFVGTSATMQVRPQENYESVVLILKEDAEINGSDDAQTKKSGDMAISSFLAHWRSNVATDASEAMPAECNHMAAEL